MNTLHKPAIAILASGSGSTAEAFIHATRDGRVDGEVGLVISDKEDAGVFNRVARLNRLYGLDIRALCVSKASYPRGAERRGITSEQSEVMANLMVRDSIGHVGLMGFMQVVQGELLDEFGWNSAYKSIYLGRMTNTHPGLLPATADTHGLGASRRVVELRLPASAHTVHLVSEGVDAGPVLCSTPVPVEAGDTSQTLFDRVQVVEKAVLPLVLDKFLKDQETYKKS